MTPRTLFSIILKTLGIFFIKDIWEMVPQIISVLLYTVKSEAFGESLVSLVSLLLAAFIYGVFCFYLIFRTDIVIEKLKLDKDFDTEPIPLNIHRSTILSIAIIVIGGLLIINEIPNFCQRLLAYIQQSGDPYHQKTPTVSYIVMSALKIATGFLLLYEKRWIVDFIELQQRK